MLRSHQKSFISLTRSLILYFLLQNWGSQLNRCDWSSLHPLTFFPTLHLRSSVYMLALKGAGHWEIKGCVYCRVDGYRFVR